MSKYAVHICCHGTSLADLPRKKKRDIGEVLRVLHSEGRFSAFDIDDTLAPIIDHIIAEKYITTDNKTRGYPWVLVELTDKGMARIPV